MIDCEQNKLCEMILPEEDEPEVCENALEHEMLGSNPKGKYPSSKGARKERCQGQWQTALTAAEKEEDKTLIHAGSSCRLSL